MPSANDIVVRYTADITDLQKKTAAVSQTIQRQVTPAVTDLRKTTATESEKIKSSFLAMSQGMRVLGDATGATKNQMVSMAITGTTQLAIVTEGVKLLAQSWKAGLVAAVAAAGYAIGAALGDMVRKTKEVRDEQQHLLRSVYGLAEAVRRERANFAEYNKALEATKEYLTILAIKEDLFGQTAETTRERVSRLTDQVVKTQKALQEETTTHDGLVASLSRHRAALEKITPAYQAIQEEARRLEAMPPFLAPPSAMENERWRAVRDEYKRHAEAVEELTRKIAAHQSRLAGLRAEMDSWNSQLARAIRTQDEFAERGQFFERLREGWQSITKAAAGYAVGAIDAIEAQNKAAKQAMDDLRAWHEEWRHVADMPTIIADQVQQSAKGFMQWMASLQINLASLHEGIMAVSTSLTQGLGNAFAQVIVYGQEFGEAMTAMIKQVAATFISFLVQMLAQQLVYFVLEMLGLIKATSAKIGAMMAEAAVAAARSAYVALPFPANMIAAPAAGAAAIATMKALAAAGIAAGKSSMAGLTAGFAEGGIVTGPMMALVGEGRQREYIMPQSDYERAIGAGRGETHVHMHIDGEEIASYVVQKVPGVVHRRLGHI